MKESYASAIFPKVACLLNHSCNPNTSVVCQKDIQITFATRTILKDEEICHIYNCHFEREVIQAVFIFECEPDAIIT